MHHHAVQTIDTVSAKTRLVENSACILIEVTEVLQRRHAGHAPKGPHETLDWEEEGQREAISLSGDTALCDQLHRLFETSPAMRSQVMVETAHDKPFHSA